MPGLLAGLTGAASLLFALNIGANNSAAEMGPAYGAGVRSRRQALGLIVVFCTAGAILAGGRVVHTVGHGLIGEGALGARPSSALIVIVAAVSLVALANMLRVPVSTAHAVVGAMVGLGLFLGTANYRLIAVIVGWWVATPLVSVVVSYLLGRWLYPRVLRGIGSLRSESAVYRVLGWAITLSAAWMAFSAGSNSLAKAMGPAVGAGVFSSTTAALVGGPAMALGALLWGGRMIKTVGKGITSLCPVCAVMVQVVSASLVFTASRFGMPVSLAEIVTCSVIGFGCAAEGVRGTAGNSHVRRILVLWPAAPVTAAVLAVGLLLVFS